MISAQYLCPQVDWSKYWNDMESMYQVIAKLENLAKTANIFHYSRENSDGGKFLMRASNLFQPGKSLLVFHIFDTILHHDDVSLIRGLFNCTKSYTMQENCTAGVNRAVPLQARQYRVLFNSIPLWCAQRLAPSKEYFWLHLIKD